MVSRRNMSPHVAPCPCTSCGPMRSKEPGILIFRSSSSDWIIDSGSSWTCVGDSTSSSFESALDFPVASSSFRSRSLVCFSVSRLVSAPISPGLHTRKPTSSGTTTLTYSFDPGSCPFRPLSPFSSSSSSESAQPPLAELCLLAVLDRLPDPSRCIARAEEMAERHRARGSKCSRSPTARSCSVEGSCVVSHCKKDDMSVEGYWYRRTGDVLDSQMPEQLLAASPDQGVAEIE
jgi:hypothetical protein